MKYSEFHRKIKKEGWIHIRTKGSHYIYEKDGKKYPVPYHGSKEIPTGLQKRMAKEMGIE